MKKLGPRWWVLTVFSAACVVGIFSIAVRDRDPALLAAALGVSSFFVGKAGWVAFHRLDREELADRWELTWNVAYFVFSTATVVLCGVHRKKWWPLWVFIGVSAVTVAYHAAKRWRRA